MRIGARIWVEGDVQDADGLIYGTWSPRRGVVLALFPGSSLTVVKFQDLGTGEEYFAAKERCSKRSEAAWLG